MMRELSTRDRLLEALRGSEPSWRDSMREMFALPATVSEEVAGVLAREAREKIDARAGMTLQELSNRLGLKPPSLIPHLRKLESQGWIRREPGRPRSPVYRLENCFEAEWTDPANGLVLRWRSPRGIDWRFPLVSRLPDMPGQRLLARLLVELEAVRKDAEIDGQVPDIVLVAYGSCARGNARPGSDLDLLALSWTKTPKRVVDAMKAVVREASLWVERPVQLQFVDLAAWKELPGPLRAAILRDGITVHWFSDSPQLIESALWRFMLDPTAEATP